MSTFRAVVKPRKKQISTDVTGIVDFEDKFNSIDFSAAQSQNITTLTNTLHFIDGQTIVMHNSGATDVILDGSLMEDGLPVDIEQDTTALLFWMSSQGKFKDQGGSARTKNLEDDFAAHTHNGTDAPKVKAIDLETTGSSAGNVLVSNGSDPEWKNISRTRFRAENTDTITNLNSGSSFSTPVPIIGTTTYIDSDDFERVNASTIKTKFAGKIRVVMVAHIFSSVERANPAMRFKKNGTTLIGPVGNTYIRNQSNNNEGTVIIIDEFDCADQDTFQLLSKQESAGGAATLSTAGTSVLLIERVDNAISSPTPITNLANINDVVLTNLQDQDRLVYNNGTWINQSVEEINNDSNIQSQITALQGAGDVLFEDDATVYADATAPIEDPTGRDGWYYKSAGSPDKVNWYFHDGQANPVTVGQWERLYTVATVDSSSNDTFHLAYYTFPLGDGQDAGSWYRSRIVYVPSGSFERGVKTLFYMGQEPDASVYPDLPRVQMTVTTVAGSNVGLNENTEVIMTSVLGTNSGASAGTVEILVNKLGFNSSVYNKEYSLEIRGEFTLAGIKQSLLEEAITRQNADSVEEQSRIDGDNALDTRLSPIEGMLEYKHFSIYDSNSAVFADASKGREDENLREGWYYTNDGQDGFNKINWYFHDGQKDVVTLEDFSAYAVMTFDDASESPIMSVYTFPTGTNDGASWYHSRVNYSGLSSTPEVGKKYVVYFGQDPEAHPELPRLEILKSNSTSIGEQVGTEVVMTSAFGSNSIAPVGAVKFMVESLGVNSPEHKTNIKLKIHHATQEEFDALQSQVNALDGNFATDAELSQAVSDLQNEIDADVLVEKQRAEAEEVRIEAKLDQEVSDRQTADSNIQSQITSLEGAEDVLFEDNAGVYADGTAAIEDPTGRDGWYYKSAGSPDKVNWYFHDGQTNPLTVGQWERLYTVATVDSSSNDTFHLAYYTLPLGDGQDAGAWYRSRQVYTPQLPFDRGVKTLFYFGDEPDASLYPELPRVSMVKSASSSVGPNDVSEFITTSVFGTNSAASAGSVELLVNKLGFNSSVYNKEYSLEIRGEFTLAGIKQSILEEAIARQNANSVLDIRVSALEAVSFEKENFVMSAQNISDGFIDLQFEAKEKSIRFHVGRLGGFEDEDYSVSVVNGVTRITFIGSFAAGGAEEIAEGDKVKVQYSR